MLEQSTFETIELLNHCKNLDEVKQIFGKAAAQFGATAFIICDIPPDAPAGKREIYASGWNTEWQERYLSLDYAKVDPIPNNVNRTVDPYYWHEAEQAWSGAPKSMQVMSEAKGDFGMLDGYCVPIHGLRGVSGLVSIATAAKGWRLSEREDAALHMISIYGYEAVRKLKIKPTNSSGGPRLSPRELDCINWMAEGKTSWEIGKILNISEDTVKQYAKTATQKFGVCNRIHLVARLYRLGILK
jgi:LuxR family transcriptional regulator, quorum-sensing system regulator BjaR1